MCTHGCLRWVTKTFACARVNYLTVGELGHLLFAVSTRARLSRVLGHDVSLVRVRPERRRHVQGRGVVRSGGGGQSRRNQHLTRSVHGAKLAEKAVFLEAEPSEARYSHGSMRIALVSDIHANLVALDAALADIARRQVDQIVCLGDIADLGPNPAATLERLRELGCVCVQGNHDPFSEHFPGLETVVQWCQAQLSEQQLAFLDGLPATHTVALSPSVQLLCVHGSPHSYDTQFIQTTSDDELRAWSVGDQVVVTACGHTHVQLLRRVDAKTYVNVGSVGSPFAAPFDGKNPPRCLKRIEYGIVEWKEGLAPAGGTLGVELVSLPLDFEAYSRAIRAAGFPEPDAWLRQWD